MLLVYLLNSVSLQCCQLFEEPQILLHTFHRSNEPDWETHKRSKVFTRGTRAELLDVLTLSLVSVRHNRCCLTQNHIPRALNSFVEVRMKTVCACQTKLALIIKQGSTLSLERELFLIILVLHSENRCTKKIKLVNKKITAQCMIRQKLLQASVDCFLLHES